MKKSELSSRLSELASHAPSSALLAGALIFAYLLGIIYLSIHRAVLTIILGGIPLFLLLRTPLLPALLLVVLALSLVDRLPSIWKHVTNRFPRASALTPALRWLYRSRFTVASRSFYERLLESIRGMFQLARKVFTPGRSSTEYFVIAYAVDLLEGDSSNIGRLVNQAPARTLRALCRHMTADQLDRGGVRTKADLLSMIRRSYIDPGAEASLRTTVTALVSRSINARTTFLEMAMDQRDWAESANRVLEMASVRLRVTSTDLFGEYDKARSEGEFRLAIATPIAFMVGALLYFYRPHLVDASDWRPDSVVIGYAVMAGVAIQARRKFSESDQLLAHALHTGVLPVPPRLTWTAAEIRIVSQGAAVTDWTDANVIDVRAAPSATKPARRKA